MGSGPASRAGFTSFAFNAKTRRRRDFWGARGEGWSFMVGDFFLPRRLIDLVVLLRYLLTNEY